MKFKDSKAIKFDLNKYKSLIYIILFYGFGLFIGSYSYKTIKPEFLNNMLSVKDLSILNMFFTATCVYSGIFFICLFLGFCLISKPIINIIPLLYGLFYGVKLGYYFVEYDYRGVIYSLIMIIPFLALFLTVLAYVIDESIGLSNQLIRISKGEGQTKIDLPPHLKKYSIYYGFTILIALANALFTKLLLAVVTI